MLIFLKAMTIELLVFISVSVRGSSNSLPFLCYGMAAPQQMRIQPAMKKTSPQLYTSTFS